MKRYIAIVLFVLTISIILSGCGSDDSNTITLENIPSFSDVPYVELYNNIPGFDNKDYSTESYEYYSELDELGRCGVVMACIGTDIMPTTERGSIGMIKPAGWHLVKYDCVDGKYLYNRCHLIGYQLSGENANTKNLITGTRYMNVEGMLPFENMVADYVKETDNHVLYRVTPIYKGDNLLADGLQIEAYSVEDSGAGISFNVFTYNAQPQITIDYANGESYFDGVENVTAEADASISDSTDFESETRESETTEQVTEGPIIVVQESSETTINIETSSEIVESESIKDNEKIYSYVLNTNTKKFHELTCSSVDEIKENNRKDYSGTREALLEKGFKACGRCKP